MRVHVVDASAFTPPYNHALCSALGRGGASVELITSHFLYGDVPEPEGYVRRERFYRHLPGAAGSRLRRVAKAATHVPDMLAYNRVARKHADVVHFQWLDMQWLDAWLLPRRPLVITAHDLLPREPLPGQARAQQRLYNAVDAIVVHSRYGYEHLVQGLQLDPQRVHVIHHGAFHHLSALPSQPLPSPLDATERPVVLFFGLIRPYKGVETLLEAWRGIDDAELWIAGRPRMALEPLRALAADNVRFVPRFVPDGELAALFRRADIIVLPYTSTERFDQSGVLATALAFGKPIVLSDVGGFGEVAEVGAARLVAPDDPGALHDVLTALLARPDERERLAQGARAAADGPYSWDAAAQRTLALYRTIIGR